MSTWIIIGVAGAAIPLLLYVACKLMRPSSYNNVAESTSAAKTSIAEEKARNSARKQSLHGSSSGASRAGNTGIDGDEYDLDCEAYRDTGFSKTARISRQESLKSSDIGANRDIYSSREADSQRNCKAAFTEPMPYGRSVSSRSQRSSTNQQSAKDGGSVRTEDVDIDVDSAGSRPRSTAGQEPNSARAKKMPAQEWQQEPNSGKTQKSPYAPEESGDGHWSCKDCGEMNRSDRERCNNCGAARPAQHASQPPRKSTTSGAADWMPHLSEAAQDYIRRECSSRPSVNTKKPPPPSDPMAARLRSQRLAQQLLPPPSEDLPACAVTSVSEVYREMLDGMLGSEAERKNVLRDLQRQWHPDKNSQDMKDIATAVFQYINTVSQAFLAGVPAGSELRTSVHHAIPTSQK